MLAGPAAPMSHRKAQIEATLKRVIAQIMARQLQDPRIAGLVSITGVELSPDRREATVSVSVLPAQYESRSVHGLNAAAGYIQSKVARAVRQRTMPSLRFVADASLKQEAQVLDAIRQAVAEDRRADERGGAPPPPADQAAGADPGTPSPSTEAGSRPAPEARSDQEFPT